MYSSSQLRRALAHPEVFLREANRLYHRRGYRRRFNTAGTDIFAEDWDTLVILDGCRRDLFEAQVDYSGRAETRISRGSTTVEFLRGNLAGRDLLDTVYVTANPQFYRHRDEFAARFHETIDVWRDSGWDETYGTVLPETVTEHAIEAFEEYPDKRILVHYIQPHYPFLTDETSFDKGYIESSDGGEGDFWSRIFTGELEVDRDRLLELYRANLERALPHVEVLLDNIAGKTIVTADHGNMVGERARPFPIREWGHPEGLYTDALVNVPWFVVEDGRRRKHISGKPNEHESDVDDADVTDRLESLGYME